MFWLLMLAECSAFKQLVGALQFVARYAVTGALREGVPVLRCL